MRGLGDQGLIDRVSIDRIPITRRSKSTRLDREA